MTLIQKLHVLLAESLRCLDDGQFTAVRRKVSYADALVYELEAPGAVTGADSALDPVGGRGQDGLRALNDSLETTSTLAAVPAQEEACGQMVPTGTGSTVCRRPAGHPGVCSSQTWFTRQATRTAEDIKQLPDWLRDPAAVPAQEEGWQPIETAPQDHSWFLAWSADLGYFVYRSGPGLIAAEEPDPTHWMPLPPPPRASAAPHDARGTADLRRRAEAFLERRGSGRHNDHIRAYTYLDTLEALVSFSAEQHEDKETRASTQERSATPDEESPLVHAVPEVDSRRGLVALTALPAQEEGWQPMETAPQDRTSVIVFCPLRSTVGEAFFDPDSHGGTWWWANQSEDYYTSPMRESGYEPTHWMPLPQPPGAPAAPHDARETTEVEESKEDPRVAPASTLPSPGSTAKNLDRR